MKKLLSVALVLVFVLGMVAYSEPAVEDGSVAVEVPSDGASAGEGASEPDAGSDSEAGEAPDDAQPSDPQEPEAPATPEETADPAEEIVDPAVDEDDYLPSAEEMAEYADMNDTLDVSGIPDVPVDDKWWNILLLGGDSRGTQDYGRTDSMIIVSVNLVDAQVKMTSIMRDTWVNFPGTTSSGKINAANVYGGPELVMETVNEAFGTNIEKYVLVNMNGLVEIIDLVGGIDLEISESERNYTNQYAASYIDSVAAYAGETQLNSAGLVHMNGLLATSYARNRYTDNDYGRVMRQQKVLLALADRAREMSLVELLALAKSFLGMTETNLDLTEIASLATTFLSLNLEDGVAQYRVPVDCTFNAGIFGGVWSIRPNFEKNQKLLRQFIYAGDSADVTAAAE